MRYKYKYKYKSCTILALLPFFLQFKFNYPKCLHLVDIFN